MSNWVRGRFTAVMVAGVVWFLAAGTVSAAVTLPPVFSSHMVLQREMPVPVWGMADANEKVTVSVRDQQKVATADAQGKWMVKLDPLAVGDAATLTVAGSNTISLTDVLVGEVWVGSGQSNMDTSVGVYINSKLAPPGADNAKGPSVKDAVNPYHIRDEALAELARGTYPQLRLIRSGDAHGWVVANPKTTESYSAPLFVFGQRLQKELDVPVGVMFGAVGATSSEQWISREAYQSDDACKQALAKFAATYSFDAEQQKYAADLAAYNKWAATTQATPQPGTHALAPAKPRPPAHPGAVTRDLTLPNKNIGDLYELHIRPFIPYAIRGVLWDQGEGDTGIFGLNQYPLMGALIRGWRKDWGQGDFPFLYVQKPSGGGCAWDANDPVTKLAADPFEPLPKRVPLTRDGLLRETYLQITQYPNTTMVTASDLGGGTHPVNKFGYGSRAARVALGAVYGRKIEFYGPMYAFFAMEGDKMRIHYTHVGQGLAFAGGGKLQGFMLAGNDQKFVWAVAVIDGDTVLVSAAGISKPVAVRYAWSKYCAWANLFNKDGLPAQAFRTDDWPATE